MLMNNLDPEVAEKPQELVVYGGRGKAARNWEAFDAIVATLKELADDETLLVQSGKPVGFSGPSPRAPGPDRQREPGGAVGHLGALPRAGAKGPHDVRPDDGRLVDLHRHAGHPPGHLRDLRGHGPEALRGFPEGSLDPHRGAGGDGRSPTPGRHLQRGRDPGGGGGSQPNPTAPGHPLLRPVHREPGRGPGLGASRRPQDRGEPSPSAWWGTAPRSFPRSCGAGSSRTSSRIRRRPTTR